MLDEKRRGECFRLLAACFYKPQKLVFTQEKVFQNLTSLLEQVCPDAAHCSKKMWESFLNYSEEELSIEYAKLFVGPYELKAPPYGSVYQDGGRRIWGDSTMEVAAIYKKAGLSMEDDFKEPPDHIAVELEFMHYLIYRETNASINSKIQEVIEFLKYRELFLKKYLGAWISDFSRAIRQNSDNPFYTNLAKCTEIFIKTDMDYLSKAIRKNDG